MGLQTYIEWCDSTWNPTSGCTPISEGCRNCWARRMAKRLAGRCGYPADNPFHVTFHEDQLSKPLHWKKPRRIAVSLMGDLFHEDVPFEWVDRVFAVMAIAQQHTFLVLTKRPRRMAEYLSHDHRDTIVDSQVCEIRRRGRCPWTRDCPVVQLPLGNVWLGTSIENQRAADERISWLLKCQAAVRFLSMEPLLGAVDLRRVVCERRSQLDAGRGFNDWTELFCDSLTGFRATSCCSGVDGPKLDWVIVGGESGPGARPMHPAWARAIRDQCQMTGVPFFFKQWGDWAPGEFGTPIPDCLGIKKDDQEYFHYFDDPPYKTWKVGKQVAGRLLDGRKWNEMPEARHQ